MARHENQASQSRKIMETHAGEQRAEFESLVTVAALLDQHMPPLHPSPEFVATLGAELLATARERAAKRQARHRRSVLIAAVSAAALSIASIAAVVFVLVRRLRSPAEARDLATP